MRSTTPMVVPSFWGRFTYQFISPLGSALVADGCLWCVVPFAVLLSTSIIPATRSSRLIDWFEVGPCLWSYSRISTMILVSISMRKYVSENAGSEMLARGFLWRNLVMMS